MILKNHHGFNWGGRLWWQMYWGTHQVNNHFYLEKFLHIQRDVMHKTDMVKTQN